MSLRSARPQPDSCPREVSSRRLVAIKVLHTLVWAFFGGCVVAIPWFAWCGNLPVAAWLITIVAIEVFVLVFNRWRCPLTDIAARYTDDRRDNFDIYLPEWLAKYNKLVFGTLYVLGVVWVLTLWALD